MALHFEASEYKARIKAVIKVLDKQGLDGLLMFQPGEHVLPDRLRHLRLLLLPVPLSRCRRPDRAADARTRSAAGAAHLQHRGHPHLDGHEGAEPAVQLKDMLESLGVKGKRLGIETDAYGLTARNGKRLEAAMAGSASSPRPPISSAGLAW